MIHSLIKDAVCNQTEESFLALDKAKEDFIKNTNTQKDPKKITFGDIDRGMCFEDVVDYCTLVRYSLLDIEQRIKNAVNVSLACGDPYTDNIAEIWKRKEKMYEYCEFEYKVSIDTYLRVMKTIPYYYGGMLSHFDDLQKGIIHIGKHRIKLITNRT